MLADQTTRSTTPTPATTTTTSSSILRDHGAGLACTLCFVALSQQTLISLQGESSSKASHPPARIFRTGI